MRALQQTADPLRESLIAYQVPASRGVLSTCACRERLVQGTVDAPRARSDTGTDTDDGNPIDA